MNFTVSGANHYAGTDNKPGTFSFDPATSRVVFTGGTLDGVMPAGSYVIYHVLQGRPTVSFMGAGGAEAAFCQRK